VIWNGYPTGVAVVPAMTHGGPYPSSTSSLHSAVGTTAIRRFLRPVSYQNVPDAILPPELQAANPLRIERLVNGARTRQPL
jgi:NADP-dependent aldehyde dehydrogenase